MDADLLTYGGLFVLALVAGTVDAMAGGGGLLTVPGLFATGLEPVSVFATNKVQGIFSSLSASVHFWRQGKVNLRENAWPALASFAGAAAGAASLTLIDPQLLRDAVPYLLIAVAIWVLFSPKLGHVESKAHLSTNAYGLTLVPLIGFYDGFFGPGTGTFFALSMVALRGHTLSEATVRAKLFNLASNVGALSVFIFAGHIAWVYGIVMAAGMIIGGNIGARLVLKHGTALIRPLLVIVSIAMSIRLLLTR